jgi:hypothetical protein
VDGVYLVPVDLIAECAAAARRLRFPVPCPTLMPNPVAGADPPSCHEHSFSAGGVGCSVAGAFDLEFGPFAALAYPAPGFGSLSATVVILAIRGSLPADSELPYFLLCSGVRPSSSVQIPFLGPVGKIVDCPTDYSPPLGGHTILRWTRGGITYEVAVSSGVTPETENVALEIASHLRLTR